MIKPLLAALAVAALGTSPTLAQSNCWTDAAGGTRCDDGQGQAGASVWRDSRGDVVKGYSDGEGNSVYRDSRGRVVTGHSDGHGNSIWRDDRGRTVVGHSEAVGGRSYKDRTGRTVRCKSYGQGREICR